MKRWALIVAVLYMAILAVLTVPAIMLAFAPKVGPADAAQAYYNTASGTATNATHEPVEAAQVYLNWPYWLWLAVMGVSQFALLSVPVRVASLRPVTRGPIWRTLLAGGFMAGLMAAAAFLSLYEFMSRLEGKGNWAAWAALGLGVLTWLIWGAIFARLSRSMAPADLVSRQCSWLFKGSVLEFLIAVPTHIVARWRGYCCAGTLTFLGLTMGASVMLFAFGPAVFFLFVARWKRLHPPPPRGVLAKN